MSLGVEVRCVVAAPPLPEARLERTLLVALIAFTFDRLACDRPLTLAACQPLYPRPPPPFREEPRLRPKTAYQVGSWPCYL